MRTHFSVIRLAILLGSLAVGTAHADETYTFVIKKQEEKKNTRWNLADWLVTRDRMRLQDLWLQKHLPSPFEFYLGGDYRFVQSTKDERDHRFVAAAYARRMGISIESESEPSRFGTYLHFRLLGAHNQSTNLTFHGGMRSQSGPASFRSAAAGASLTLYFTNYFGGEATWRRYFAATPNSAGGDFSGTQTEANAFIDFSFLRVYGGILHQPMDAGRERGFHLGARLFF